MILPNSIVKNISQIIKRNFKKIIIIIVIVKKTIRPSIAPADFCQVKSGYVIFFLDISSTFNYRFYICG